MPSHPVRPMAVGLAAVLVVTWAVASPAAGAEPVSTTAT
jgi:hypothetical protein